MSKGTIKIAEDLDRLDKLEKEIREYFNKKKDWILFLNTETKKGILSIREK